MSNQNTSDYQFLIAKLDSFIRRFYGNAIIKGFIYFSAVFLISFLSVSVIEYFAHTAGAVRTFLFYTFILGNISALVVWVLRPALKLYKIGTRISHLQASQIIGKHFPEVSDKLLNTLQLNSSNAGSRALIEASIAQKVAELKPIPFSLAIDFKKNLKYVKYAALPLLILTFLLIRVPDVILSSSARIISYNQEFEIEAPFQFELVNKNLELLEHEDFTLQLKINGAEIPAEVYANIDGTLYRMTSNKNGNFSLELKNVEKSKDLFFEAGGFHSNSYQLVVLPKPFLKAFTVKLTYPPYTQRKEEQLSNTGDLIVPKGTVIQWKFNSENTDKVKLNFDGKQEIASQLGKSDFTWKTTAINSGKYFITTANQFVKKNDSTAYEITVVQDDYPAITVELKQDSQSAKNYFFNGEISDDYGITALSFQYRFTHSEDPTKIGNSYKSISIPCKTAAVQSYFYFWDLNAINYASGDELEFYFEVWDNDGVNGRKSSKSQRLTIKAPTKQEVEEMVEETSASMKEDMQSLIREASNVQKDLEELKNRMMSKEKLNWEDQQAVSDLMKKQQNLEEKVNKLNNEYKEMLKKQDEFSEMDERIKEKHEKLMELFDQLMTDEMKKMYEELQKMLEQNLDQAKEKLEDLEMKNEDLEKELDVALEQFKQLELEQKMEETIEKLDQLAKDQENLAKQTENKEEKKEKLAEEQEKLNDRFDELRKDLDDLQKKNEELEKPNDQLKKTDDQEESIQEDMKESNENLDGGSESKASQKQKSAKQKMEKLKENLESMKSEMEEEQQELDYEAMRALLENLLHLSFEQEQVMDELAEVHSYNPKFVELAQRQIKIQDDAKMIEDSLRSLSKSVIQLTGFITKEMGEINFNLEKTMRNLEERNIAQGRGYQQHVMTHVNNLAVMLSEVMEQMQQQMAQQKPKDGKAGNCKKPGSGKDGKPQKKGSKLGDMSKMQEELNKQLGEMKSKMARGERPLSQDLAKAAAQQEALRRELQKINAAKEAAGDKPSNQLKEIEKLMDKSEEDIVNKNITEETINRQKEILSRLLESEKAEREEEYKEERESKSAQQQSETVNKAFEEYKKQKMREIELLNTLPPQLNGYYKNKVKEYFKVVE